MKDMRVPPRRAIPTRRWKAFAFATRIARGLSSARGINHILPSFIAIASTIEHVVHRAP